MKGLACVIVLYNPDLSEVFSNIQSYSRAIEHFYVIDNSQDNHDIAIREFEQSMQASISYIFNGENLGIARALNQGCCLALKDGFSWCLLMDQDSFFLEQDLNNYISFHNQQIQHDPSVAILSLLHGGLIPDNPNAVSENAHSITSGSIIQLSVFRQSGGHDEFLFIDEVDADFSYRLEVMGFKTIRFNKATLQHRLGSIKEARLFGLIKMGQRSFHSPLRNYYMVRNYVIVRHRFIRQLPAIYKKRDREILVSVKNNLFLSGHFFSVLFQLIKGLIHGFKYRNKLPVSDLSSSI